MECLYRKDSGHIFNPDIDYESLHPAEKAHVTNPGGMWGRMEVTESMVAHVLAGHCIVQDNIMQLKPETEWQENQEIDNE